VAVHHEVELLVRDLGQRPVAQRAGVGAHHVQAAELGDGPPHQRVGRLRAADRAHLGDGPATGAGDRLDGLLGDVGVDVVDHHGGTGRAQRLGVRAAEATP
jgi:hypothetical protein